MAAVALFTVDDLALAFGMIVSAPTATEWAAEWFRQYADRIDAAGFFVYEPWWTDEGGPPPDARAGLAGGSLRHPANGAPSYAGLRGWSKEKKFEFLMRFSDVHLDLLTLVSAELSARIREIRRDSESAAARRRENVLRLVEALRD
jgi:hypothetical protein